VSRISGIEVGDDGVPRCWWGAGDPLYRRYHDTEWGRPVSNDRRLFEKLSLEGFMSGLSWLTILRKRENFRAAFAHFDPAAVARFTSADGRRLLNDQGIVRNGAKIAAVINNARLCGELQAEFGSFAAYVWGFEPPPRSRRLDHAALTEVKFSPEAAAMSKDLRKRGWSFVGPTTVYSFMQAMGLVNDHLDGCQAGAEVEASRRDFVRPRPKARKAPSSPR
jgi:DNA-3-methyladenine glycosylase I